MLTLIRLCPYVWPEMCVIESSSLPPLETQVCRAARMSFVVEILCEAMIPGHI
jgi:hypothetical protein